MASSEWIRNIEIESESGLVRNCEEAKQKWKLRHWYILLNGYYALRRIYISQICALPPCVCVNVLRFFLLLSFADDDSRRETYFMISFMREFYYIQRDLRLNQCAFSIQQQLYMLDFNLCAMSTERMVFCKCRNKMKVLQKKNALKRWVNERKKGDKHRERESTKSLWFHRKFLHERVFSLHFINNNWHKIECKYFIHYFNKMKSRREKTRKK